VRSGKKDQAIEAYEKAAQFNPADVESEINLATAYLEQANWPTPTAVSVGPWRMESPRRHTTAWG